MPSTTGDGATKIVATIADNAEKPGALDALLAAGVDVVRLNGAHAKPGDIGRRTALVRRASGRLARPVGVLLDLGGPKIRLGALPGGSVSLLNGRTVELVAGSASEGGEKGGLVRLAVTYPALLKDVKPGAEIRLDDGRVRLEVTRRLRGSLRAAVRTGGRVKSEAGVNFPDSTLTAPALTRKDRHDLAEALDAGVDFVGLSFVRSAAHVAQLRRLIAHVPEDRRPWIVAKIERPEALRDLDRIAGASDALMVARGDLGVEIGLARVPAAQREILAAGRRHAVPVIVATQMLESMVENPRPTRAEASDVANAILDGADAVMLSEETAMGAHPIEAVTAMGEIADAALARTTHLAIAAHADDIEIMAYHGILACFGRADAHFTGVVVTDGAGSPRAGRYAGTSDAAMRLVRREEQMKAATIGAYAAQVLLDHPSAAVKDASSDEVVADLLEILRATRPAVVYTHNLADRHDTHVAVALRTLAAIRRLPAAARPDRVIGCEAWRDLDWLADDAKVVMDVGGHDELAAALLGVFVSQIAAGKRYDLATQGRRLAHATYAAGDAVDATAAIIFGMDLTPLVGEPARDPAEYIAGLIAGLAADVAARLRRVS